MVKIVLVGGPTGIGKSTFIDSLLSDRESREFYRPISYTTRPPRLGETRQEYEHISHDDFQRMNDGGAFVTVDKIYENYYSISRSSIQEIIERGGIAIKEVHPSNHGKLKALLPDVLSVLILPEDSDKFWTRAQSRISSLGSDRLLRLHEDQAFYESLDTSAYPFDIVLRVSSSMSTEALKTVFIASLLDKIVASKGCCITALEEQNKVGYDLIANEFFDDRRVTTANFHDLSIDFFNHHVESYRDPDQIVLDLGAGTGYLTSKLKKLFKAVVAVDISSTMLSLIQPDPGIIKVVASAFNLPFPDETFKIIVCSLADPFLLPEALHEIARVLTHDGAFIFNSPSKIWSDALRSINHNSELNVTRFVHSSGNEVSVHSFTYTDVELQNLVKSCGFRFEVFEVAHGRGLKSSPRPISSALTQAAQKLGLGVDDLPILQLMVVRKDPSENK
ncbi:methyltransferase domain-containing protein [Coleofasciculus sp. H7-2]|uniref:methyltransferase domain-containing protein n=1 Tax=Coleofasciculus sp. H7-2 TaxID=3351545 RepID=UPI00366BAE8A